MFRFVVTAVLFKWNEMQVSGHRDTQRPEKFYSPFILSIKRKNYYLTYWTPAPCCYEYCEEEEEWLTFTFSLLGARHQVLYLHQLDKSLVGSGPLSQRDSHLSSAHSKGRELV